MHCFTTVLYSSAGVKEKPQKGAGSPNQPLLRKRAAADSFYSLEVSINAFRYCMYF